MKFVLMWMLVAFCVALVTIRFDSPKRDDREVAKLIISAVIGLFVALRFT